MISFEQLQRYMEKNVEEDRNNAYVDITGDTLEEVLRTASIELSAPIKRIEYEIVEQGSAGVMGLGKRPMKIIARALKKQEAGVVNVDSVSEPGEKVKEKVLNKNGEIFIRRAQSAFLMKITEPVGTGEPVIERKALTLLHAYNAQNVDTKMVGKTVKRADGQWIKVADMEHDFAHDAVVRCEVLDSEMLATVTIAPPREKGADADSNMIRAVLAERGVVFGIDEELLLSLEEKPRYRETIVIAKGERPQNGNDSTLELQVRLNQEAKQLTVQDNGRIDFHEVSQIENVVENQMIAKVIPAGQGKDGQAVTGRILQARDGRDIPPPLGDNTRLSDDGETVLASISGLVRLVNEKITVEPMYIVDGDVNLSVGNIRFLGTVVIKGNVDDGFSVNAAGDIEVHGTVGKSVIEAEGNVVVHQGITGKNEGKIKAGGSVWAKFIENTEVNSEEMVVVSDGVINSRVFSGKCVICRGKRATIVGGRIAASEEIEAKILGSVAGMETILEVGYDPKSRNRLIELTALAKEIDEKLAEIDLNAQSIRNAIKTKKEISKEKRLHYKESQQKRTELLETKSVYAVEIQEIQEFLEQISTTGRISASGQVFPGVKISIDDSTFPVRREARGVTYVRENGKVTVTKYVESLQDIAIQ